MNDDQVFVLILIGFFTFVLPMSFIIGIPWAKAMRRRLESRSDAASPELAAELEDLRGRVAELEERADFAERLLARQRDPERLPGGPA
jgi:hypothetical protein